MAKFSKAMMTLVLAIVMLNPTYSAQASDSAKIASLEKRVASLEAEVKHLREQEVRASKYLKCIQGVKGNYLTFPIRVMNCLRK